MVRAMDQATMENQIFVQRVHELNSFGDVLDDLDRGRRRLDEFAPADITHIQELTLWLEGRGCFDLARSFRHLVAVWQQQYDD